MGVPFFNWPATLLATLNCAQTWEASITFSSACPVVTYMPSRIANPWGAETGAFVVLEALPLEPPIPPMPSSLPPVAEADAGATVVAVTAGSNT